MEKGYIFYTDISLNFFFLLQFLVLDEEVIMASFPGYNQLSRQLLDPETK